MKCRLLIIAFLITLFGCAHPYVGKTVNSYSPLWCRINMFPISCMIAQPHLKFVYETDFNSATGEYSVQGHAEPVSIKSFSNFQVEKSNFYLVLAKDGIITDVISFFLPSNSVQDKIPFNFKFKSKQFDSMSIIYEFWVSG